MDLELGDILKRACEIDCILQLGVTFDGRDCEGSDVVRIEESDATSEGRAEELFRSYRLEETR